MLQQNEIPKYNSCFNCNLTAATAVMAFIKNPMAKN